MAIYVETTVGEKRCLAAALQVKRLFDLSPDEASEGVVEFGEEVYPLVDLHREFGVPQPEHRGCMLVSFEGHRYGLVFSSFLRVVELGDHEFMPLPVRSERLETFFDAVHGNSSGGFFFRLALSNIHRLVDDEETEELAAV